MSADADERLSDGAAGDHRRQRVGCGVETGEDGLAMYERAGYTRIERYNDNPYAEAFFAKPLSTMHTC